MRLRSSLFGGLNKKQRHKLKSDESSQNNVFKLPTRDSRVRKHIELTKKIAEEEMGWFKEPRWELRDGLNPKIGSPRKRYEVKMRDPILGEAFDIHTHILEKGDDGISLPSKQDYIAFLRELTMPEKHSVVLRTMIVSVVNANALEMGRTFVYLPRKERINFNNFRPKLVELRSVFKKSKYNTRKLMRIMQEIGFKFRFVPAPGFRFDKFTHNFVLSRDN